MTPLEQYRLRPQIDRTIYFQEALAISQGTTAKLATREHVLALIDYVDQVALGIQGCLSEFKEG